MIYKYVVAESIQLRCQGYPIYKIDEERGNLKAGFKEVPDTKLGYSGSKHLNPKVNNLLILPV